MPNKIVVGAQVFTMDVDYLTGALHERVGLKTLYKDTGTESWANGRRNEARRQHIRFGLDILTSPDKGTLFAEDLVYLPAETDASGRYVLSEANYRRDFFHATGAYQAFNMIGGSSSSPGELRKKLGEVGIFISTQDCALLSQLQYHDRNMVGATLTEEEIEMVESLREPQRRILEICADITDKDWHCHPESWLVSSKARRNAGWATSTVLKMDRDGLGFLIGATGNGWIDIKAKGITAVRHLRARDEALGTAGLPVATRTGRARRVW